MITKEKIIILFDVDETLLEKAKYPACATLIKDSISDLQKKRMFSVGICTHRPWVDIKDIYSFYKMDGPIICEGGGVLKSDINSKAQLLTNDLINKNIEQILLKSFGKDINLVDNFELLTEKSIYINKKRAISSSIYFSEEAKSYMKDVAILLEKSGYIPRLEKDNGKITVSQKGISKFKTIQKLFNKENRKIYFITDFEDLPAVYMLENIILCSVGNNAVFNRSCDFVSDDLFSKGTILAMDYIKQKELDI